MTPPSPPVSHGRKSFSTPVRLHVFLSAFAFVAYVGSLFTAPPVQAAENKADRFTSEITYFQEKATFQDRATANTFEFINLPDPVGAVSVTVFVKGDFNHSKEISTVTLKDIAGQNPVLGQTNPGNECGNSYVPTSFIVPAERIVDGKLTIEVAPSINVGLGCSTHAAKVRVSFATKAESADTHKRVYMQAYPRGPKGYSTPWNREPMMFDFLKLPTVLDDIAIDAAWKGDFDASTEFADVTARKFLSQAGNSFDEVEVGRFTTAPQCRASFTSSPLDRLPANIVTNGRLILDVVPSRAVGLGCVESVLRLEVSFPVAPKSLPTAWEFDLAAFSPGPPVVDGDQVFILAGLSLFSIDTVTGEKRWEVPVSSASGSKSPGRIVAAEDGKVFFQNGRVEKQATLHVLDGATGKELWTASLGTSATDPIVAGGMVYIGGSDSLLTGFSVEGCGGQATCPPVWRAAIPGRYFGYSPTVGAKQIFVLGELGGNDAPAQALFAFPLEGCEGETPCEPLWSHFVGDVAKGAPFYADGVVYVPTKIGLKAVDATLGELLWRHPGEFFHQPYAVDGVVYAGSATGMRAIDATSGATLWRVPLADGEIEFAAPTVSNGLLFVTGGGNRNLQVFDIGACESRAEESCHPRWISGEESAEQRPAVDNGVVFVADRPLLRAYELP